MKNNEIDTFIRPSSTERDTLFYEKFWKVFHWKERFIKYAGRDNRSHPQMTEKEPQLFKDWSEYAKQRQVMASATLFKSHGWYHWTVGHAKLYGILLWHYETKKQISFKYSKILKKEGYRRTHNYRLLKTITEKELLQKEGSGYYSITTSKIITLERVLSLIKELDMVGSETEVKTKSENTASSDKTTKKNAKRKNV